MANILIIVGGSKKKLEGFEQIKLARGLENVHLASFSDLNFNSENGYNLVVGDRPVTDFQIIYIRMVGKRLEEASLLVNYALAHNIRIIDSVYHKDHFVPSSIAKAVELSKLIEANIPIPTTYVASVSKLKNLAPEKFGFPFVIKSTSGRKARDAWSPQDQVAWDELVEKLKAEEKAGKKFFAQSFIPNSQRIRVLVVGSKAVAAITRPSKWRKRLGEVQEIRSAIEITPQMEELSLKAAKAVDLDIAGVDIMEDSEARMFILEVNAAPAWELIKKDTGVNVEEVVMDYLLAL